MRIFVLAILALMITSVPYTMSGVSDAGTADEHAVAQRFLSDLEVRDLKSATVLLEPDLQKHAGDEVTRMASEVPQRPAVSFTLLASSSLVNQRGRFVQLAYEVKYEDASFLLYQCTLTVVSDHAVISRASVQPYKQSAAISNAVTFSGKPVSSCLFLALSWGVFLFSAYSALAAYRISNLRRKWLWVAWSLTGYGMVMLNWTTGDITQGFVVINGSSVRVNFLTFGLPTVSFWKMAYLPLFIAVRIPVGALHFWSRRRALIAESSPDASKAADVASAEVRTVQD